MIVYFDTSALMKLFLQETGTDTVRELWEGATGRVTSVAAYPEARSAIAAATRSGRMSGSDAEEAVVELGIRYETMDVIVLDEHLAVEAGEQAARHPLRGYDAVHLASALSVGDALMATWDGDLARAAEDAGLAVVTA